MSINWKQWFQKGNAHKLTHYPVKDEEDLGDSITMVSPRPGFSHGLDSPPCDSEELDEVWRVRNLAMHGVWPSKWLKDNAIKCLPDNYDPDRVYEAMSDMGLYKSSPETYIKAVSMDDPMDLPLAIKAWLMKTGQLRPKDPETGRADFMQANPGLNLKLAQRIYDNLDDAFDEKYNHGRKRPEEHYDIPCGVTTSLWVGCPDHPAYPAGHGAAAAACAVFEEELDLSQQTIDDIRAMAYEFAMTRTMCGFHYTSDNIAGLAIGGYK